MHFSFYVAGFRGSVIKDRSIIYKHIKKVQRNAFVETAQPQAPDELKKVSAHVELSKRNI